MSKLNIELTYKNACILKHALRNQILDKRQNIELSKMRCEVFSDSMSNEKYIKELQEEERALKAIEEEIQFYIEKWR